MQATALVAVAAMGAARGLRFFTRDAAIAVCIEPLEVRGAGGVEFGPRQRTVIVGVAMMAAAAAASAVMAVGTAAMTPAPTALAARLLLGRGEHAVIVGVLCSEARQRAGEIFIAAHIAIVVGVDAAAPLFAHACRELFTRRAALFARHRAVAIGVHARKHGRVAGVELGARYHAILIGIGAEDHAARPARTFTAAHFRDRYSAHNRQRRSRRRDKHLAHPLLHSSESPSAQAHRNNGVAFRRLVALAPKCVIAGFRLGSGQEKSGRRWGER